MRAQVVDSLRKGHQAMVFVHSRKDTGKTARTLVTKAQNGGDGAVFDCSDQDAYPYMAKDVKRSRNKCANTFEDMRSTCAGTRPQCGSCDALELLFRAGSSRYQALCEDPQIP